MSRACYTNRFNSLSSLDGKPEVAIAFNGTTSRIHRTFNTTIWFSRRAYPLAIKIVEASNYEMILGVDVLSKYNAVIDLGQCGFKVDGSPTIILSKKEINMNKPPSLNSATDAIISPNSIAYLECTLIGSIPNRVNAMCLSDTVKFNEDTGLALAYGVIELNKPIHVRVANLSNKRAFVKHGTYVSELD